VAAAVVIAAPIVAAAQRAAMVKAVRVPQVPTISPVIAASLLGAQLDDLGFGLGTSRGH